MKRPEELTSYVETATEPKPDPKPRPNGPGGKSRTRRWERQPENKGFTYRVGADVDQLLDQAVEEMAAEGWICTKSQMARAWLLAGRQAFDAGQVEVEGYAQNSGRSRRKA